MNWRVGSAPIGKSSDRHVADPPGQSSTLIHTYNARFFLRKGEEVTRDAEIISRAGEHLRVRNVDGVELIDHVIELGRRRPLTRIFHQGSQWLARNGLICQNLCTTLQQISALRSVLRHRLTPALAGPCAFELGLHLTHSYGYGLGSSPALKHTCPAPSSGVPDEISGLAGVEKSLDGKSQGIQLEPPPFNDSRYALCAERVHDGQGLDLLLIVQVFTVENRAIRLERGPDDERIIKAVPPALGQVNDAQTASQRGLD